MTEQNIMEQNRKVQGAEAKVAAEQGTSKHIGRHILEACLLAVLILYPMRHVWVGGDLWDVGYNFGNFAYPGIQSMGKTWFFATYLSNAIGHLLTLLPYGHTVLGMNVYTGLFASLLAVLGYLFCTRSLKISPIFAFLGEMLALSMCWCPTAKLYDYLTYVFFLACMIFLYKGLVKEKWWMLVLAGACLGLNVFVRFSNLPEMGLILAVWAYAFFDAWERGRAADQEGAQTAEEGALGAAEEGESEAGSVSWIGKGFSSLAKWTLLCIAGYVIPLAIGFGWIAFRYGIGEYFQGIKLLFAMTENAADYKPLSMIAGLIWPFKEALYWIPRLVFFAVVAFLFVMVTDYLPLCLPEKAREKGQRFFVVLGWIGMIAASLAMVIWIVFPRKEGAGRLTSFYYQSYDPVYWPCALTWMLAIGIALLHIIYLKGKKEDRLLGMMLILVGFLTSLGSNNGIYPTFNNMFVFFPYVLAEIAGFTRRTFEKASNRPKSASERKADVFPVAVVLWAFLGVVSVQIFLFGIFFVFCEGTGVKNANTAVSHNKALEGIYMSEERANALSELSEFVEREGLSGRKVILHGGVPSLSFYLGMPPAMHTWSDLDSFSRDVCLETLQGLMTDIAKNDHEKPIVITSKKLSEFGPIYPFRDSVDGVEPSGDEKWELIRSFMGFYKYEKVFENERFVVWMPQ
ncbi:MAG: hypothetical protein K6F31_01225 [Acetatifactor sp.]|nr:hypothetical protein [Acetatifactor sp.]